MTENRYHVKVRLVGKKRYDFLKADGSTTHLRIHANTWNGVGADAIVGHIVKDNPGVVEHAIKQRLTLTYTEWYDQTLEAYLQQVGQQRLGQFFFNALYNINPELANEIRGTNDDPFYNDGIFAEFCGVVAYEMSTHDKPLVHTSSEPCPTDPDNRYGCRCDS